MGKDVGPADARTYRPRPRNGDGTAAVGSGARREAYRVDLQEELPRRETLRKELPDRPRVHRHGRTRARADTRESEGAHPGTPRDGCKGLRRTGARLLRPADRCGVGGVAVQARRPPPPPVRRLI